MIGEPEGQPTQPLVQIACNIDDMNPELYGPVMDHLFAAGALDVYFTPIQMKKNRPAVMVGVIAHQNQEKELADLLLKETSTFGVRVEQVYRYEAQRKSKTVKTPFGPIRVKEKWVNNILIGTYPEYEDCKTAAETSQIPLERVYRQVLSSIESGIQQ